MANEKKVGFDDLVSLEDVIWHINNHQYKISHLSQNIEELVKEIKALPRKKRRLCAVCDDELDEAENNLMIKERSNGE